MTGTMTSFQLQRALSSSSTNESASIHRRASDTSWEFILTRRKQCDCKQSESDTAFSSAHTITLPSLLSSDDSIVTKKDIYELIEDNTKVVKPENDHRSYEAITLTNLMKCLVISDPVASKCAVALSVQAGSMNDPNDLPGLAHFCEHLIFASGKRSDEEFEKLVGYNGGDINSFTRRDVTVYGFDIFPEAFAAALQQFAKFFTDFNFTDEDIEESIAAISSEFDYAVGIDSERRDRVEASLTCPDHPYRQFDIGTKKAQILIRNTLSLWALPKSKSLILLEQAVKFLKQFYSANLMTLVIWGTESTAKLANMAEAYFGSIPNLSLKPPEWPTSPYKSEQLKTRIDIVPIADISKLQLIFPIPDFSSKYTSGIIQYVTFLIGNDGPGSLMYFLREKKWATKLEAEYKRPGKGFAFFNIHVDLTASGLKNVYNIIHNAFQYIKMLKVEGPQRWIWEEIQTMQHANFRFLPPENPLTRAENLATFMTMYPPHHYLVGKFMVRHFLPNKIKEFITYLTPANFRMIVTDKANSALTDEVEHWFGVRYRYSDIDETHINKWQDCSLHDELHLPSKNRFIPENFELKPIERTAARNKPRVISDGALSTVWFMHDTELKIPCGTITLSMLSLLPQASAKDFNCLRLIEKALMESLVTLASDASHAGLGHRMEATMMGLTITVHGFSNKLATYFEFVLSTLFQFCCTGKVGLCFQDVKEAYAEHLAKWRDQEPYLYGAEYLRGVLNPGTWTPEQLLEAYRDEDVNAHNLMTFGQKFLSKLKLQWFVYGNFTEQEAVEIYQQNMMYFERFDTQHYNPPIATEIMAESKCNDESISVTLQHPNHMSSCCALLIKTGKGSTVKELVLTEIFGAIMKRPAANVLQAEDQFLSTDVRKSKHLTGLQIILQDEKDPVTLERNIENFLGKLEYLLTKFTEKDVCRFRADLTNQKIERWLSPKARSQLLFEEIQKDTYNFQRQQQEVTQLKRISKIDVLNFYNECISPTGKSRHKISVLVASSLPRQDVIQLQNHSTEAISSMDQDNSEEKPVEPRNKSNPQDAQQDCSDQDQITKVASNAAISNVLERKSSEMTKEEKLKAERDNKLNRNIRRSHPTALTGTPGSMKARNYPSLGRLKNVSTAEDTKRTKRSQSNLLNKKQSRIRPKANPQPHPTQSKIEAAVDENFRSSAKPTDLTTWNGRAPKEVMQTWIAQIRKNQIVRENSVMVRSITSKVLYNKSTAFPLLQSYMQKANLTDEQMVERIDRLHQPPQTIRSLMSRHNIRSAKASKTVVPCKSPDVKKQIVNKTASKAAVSAASGAQGKSEHKLQRQNDSVDFRDYEFDFEAELQRLRKLKKYLQHENAVKKAEKRKKENLAQEQVIALSTFFAENEGEDQAPAPKPPVDSEYNVTYEIQRLKALQQILDTEAAKCSKSSTNNNTTTTQSPSRKQTKKVQGVSVHEVEKEIQRLKNIKRYFDGETKDLNLRSIEYTIFVVHDIKVPASGRVKSILSSVQKVQDVRNASSTVPQNGSKPHANGSMPSPKRPSISTKPRVPSHVVAPYIRMTKKSSLSSTRGNMQGCSSSNPSKHENHTLTSRQSRNSTNSPNHSHHTLTKRSRYARVPASVSMLTHLANYQLPSPRPLLSSSMDVNENPTFRSHIDPVLILERALRNAMSLGNPHVSKLLSIGSSTSATLTRASRRNQYYSSVETRRSNKILTANSFHKSDQQLGTKPVGRRSISSSATPPYAVRSSSFTRTPKRRSEPELTESKLKRMLGEAITASRNVSGVVQPRRNLQSVKSWSGHDVRKSFRSSISNMESAVRSPRHHSVEYAGTNSFSDVGTLNTSRTSNPQVIRKGNSTQAPLSLDSASRLDTDIWPNSVNTFENVFHTITPLPVIPRSLRGDDVASSQPWLLFDQTPSVSIDQDNNDVTFMEAMRREAEETVFHTHVVHLEMPVAIENVGRSDELETGSSESIREDDNHTECKSQHDLKMPSESITEVVARKHGTCSYTVNAEDRVLGKDQDACQPELGSVISSSSVPFNNIISVGEFPSQNLKATDSASSQNVQVLANNEQIHGEVNSATSLQYPHQDINEQHEENTTEHNASLIDQKFDNTQDEVQNFPNDLIPDAPVELIRPSSEKQIASERGRYDQSFTLSDENESGPLMGTTCHSPPTVGKSISVIRSESELVPQPCDSQHSTVTTGTDSVDQYRHFFSPRNKREDTPLKFQSLATMSRREISRDSRSNLARQNPKACSGKSSNVLFSNIAEAFFQLEQRNLESQSQHENIEISTVSNSSSGSGTPELRKWMKKVVSTELRMCMRELARKAMTDEISSSPKTPHLTLQPVLYNPPSRVLKAVKQFAGSEGQQISENHVQSQVSEAVDVRESTEIQTTPHETPSGCVSNNLSFCGSLENVETIENPLELNGATPNRM